ncbi:DMT family transporter [Lacticigenium naphthae]|uniref:DMT family transporter n=1 Tax=Lacticigenium naphthae TaxID=515351 RepID=UPI00041EEFBA|nr:EamA family transporter [Lacticigenium naphthae]
MEKQAKMKAISTMLIFGSIGLFVRYIPLSSLDIAFYRAFIGALFIGIYSLVRKQSFSFQQIKANRMPLLVSGTALGLNWVFLFKAFQTTTIAAATLSYYTAPIWVALLAPVFLKESVSKYNRIATALALFGVFLLSNGNIQWGGFSEDTLGIGYGLLAALFYTMVMLANKFLKDIDNTSRTVSQLGLSAIVLLPFVLGSGNEWFVNLSGLTMVEVLLLVSVGVIHTGVAYALYFSALKELKAQTVAVLSYIDPLAAVGLAFLVLGEHLSLLQMFGGACILASTMISENIFIQKKILHNQKKNEV